MSSSSFLFLLSFLDVDLRGFCCQSDKTTTEIRFGRLWPRSFVYFGTEHTRRRNTRQVVLERKRKKLSGQTWQTAVGLPNLKKPNCFNKKKIKIHRFPPRPKHNRLFFRYWNKEDIFYNLPPKKKRMRNFQK